MLCKLTMERSLTTLASTLFLHPMASSFGSRVLTPRHKTVAPNVCSAPLMVVYALSCFMLMLHLAFGPMHSPQQPFSLISSLAVFDGPI
uniref:Uncharacterized protein n=1 Tax=Triticum urartu TaxID=4572 RepID=A0A8R7Q7B2_TRIUA